MFMFEVMKKLLFILLVLACGIACNRNKQVQPLNYFEEMDKGWTSMGKIPTYRVESDGVMHCCSDCARLDYIVINGETRYRIYYPLESAYYNIVKNPEYGTNSRYGQFQYKAGSYYLNL